MISIIDANPNVNAIVFNCSSVIILSSYIYILWERGDGE